jgi:ABC-type transport system involved in multi-copper enzyme maturation permease subunit
MRAIAWITLRRITERAVLIQFGIMALVLAYVAMGLEAIVLNDAAGTEQSGMYVAWIFLTAFTVFWSTLEIPRELARKDAHVYLSKPITRLHYLLGKFLGMTSMVVGGEIVLLGIFAICLTIKGHPPSQWFYFAGARTALFLIFLNAICMAASVIFGEVPAMVAVGVVGLVGSVACGLAVLAWAGFYPWPRIGMEIAYHLLPDLLHFRWEPAEGFAGFLAGLLMYTAGWSALALTGANWILGRQDLP